MINQHKFTLVDQVPFPASPNGDLDLLKDLGRSRRRARKLRRRYGRSVVSGKGQSGAARAYFTSGAVRFYEVVEAAKRMPLKKRRSLSELKSAAGVLVHKPIKEPVQVRAKLKSNGDFRPICSFGVQHRAAQRIVCALLRPYVHEQPWQYDGKGINAAISRLIVLLEQGYTHVKHLDVKEYFGSFVAEQLPHALPLPKEVVDYAVVGKKMMAKTRTHLVSPYPLLPKACRGIPQGSVASPLVATTVMSLLNWQPPAGTAMINYVDNFLLMGGSAEAVGAAELSLRAALSLLPGGNFSLDLKEASTAEEGFAFLGHRFLMVNGKVEIWPTAENDNRFDAEWSRRKGTANKKVKEYLDNPNDSTRHDAFTALAGAHAYAKAWTQAFRACRVVEVYQKSTLDDVTGLLKQMGATVSALKPYLHGTRVSQHELYGG